MTLGSRYDEALVYATRAHRGQVRKGTIIPYISHPLAVSALVLENGGTEDQAIAALFHDVIEDCGVEHEPDIRQRFGDAVADMVLACSDATPAEGEEKPPWRQRKERYLRHLAEVPPDAAVLLVTTCDKLHNLRCIEADFAEMGDRLWERFNAGAGRQRWYYTELARILGTSESKAARECVVTVEHVFGMDREGDMVVQEQKWSGDELYSMLAVFETELQDAGLKGNAVNTYVQRSRTFVRWLRGEWRPRGPNANPGCRLSSPEAPT